MIRFTQLTQDEYFVSHGAARAGVSYDNTGDEPESRNGCAKFAPNVG